MESFVEFLAVLFVMSCGLSIMLTPTKWDLFLIARPMGRYAKRIASRSIASGYKATKRWAKATWRVANDGAKSPVVRILATLVCIVLAAGVVILFIPADIFGSGKK